MLNTVATGAALGYLATHPGGSAAHTASLVHGYTTAAGWAAGLFAAGAVLAATLITAGAPAGRHTHAGRTS